MKKASRLVLLLLLSIPPLSASENIAYAGTSVARLTCVQGSSFIQRASDLACEEGVVNMPIGEGDRIGTTEGRIEIFLGRGNYVRIDNDSKVDFLSLPSKLSDLIRMRLWSGSLYLSVGFLENEKAIEIHSSDVSLYILDEGLYRIDVRPDRETEIFVFEGLLEAAGESGSLLIKEAQRMEARDGLFTGGPAGFYVTAGDSFDQWSEYRDSVVRRHAARTYLPGEMRDFERELAVHGHWTSVSPYGNVWVPHGVPPHWRPYTNGRWVWMSICGWTWLPYEPWGWVTFHYGRWHWNMGIGWHWIPTHAWGPAWVGWYWGHDYCGWAPLSYHGYPGVIINNVYYSRYEGDYHPYTSRALTIVHKNQLRARHISKAALTAQSIKGIEKIQLKNNSPAPNSMKKELSVEKLEGGKLFLRHTTQKSRLSTSSRKKRDVIHERESSVTKRAGRIRTPPGYSQKSGLLRKKTGYPSSDKITFQRLKDNIKADSPKSAIGRIYDYFNKDGRKSIGNRFSKRTPEKDRRGTVQSRSPANSKSSTVRSSRRSSSKSASKKSSPSKRPVRTKKKKK